MQDRAKAPPNKRARAASGAPATDGGSRSLWFSPPIDDPDRRPQLTPQRIVTEALTVIAEDGIQAEFLGRLQVLLHQGQRRFGVHGHAHVDRRTRHRSTPL